MGVWQMRHVQAFLHKPHSPLLHNIEIVDDGKEMLAHSEARGWFPRHGSQ